MKKILNLILILFVSISLVACAKANANIIEKEENKNEGEYAGKTVILHSNDVHGAIEGYSYISALKADYEEKGATVILVDDGDFSNGNVYVSLSKGESAITLMEQVGYDVVTIGNHEFDFGFDNLVSNVSDRSFETICSNLYKGDELVFDDNVIIKVGKLKIGFFGLLTPETQTKVIPSAVAGLTFTEKEDMYEVAKQEIEELKKDADIIICLSHLGVDASSKGNSSYDVYNSVEGIDFIIDGHSHTVMESGDNGEPIQSTGTAFANVGVIVIDNTSKAIESNMLIATEGLEQNEEDLATAQNIIATVDEQYGIKFAETAVNLLGEKVDIRSGETNLGDLVADSMIWSATNENELEVDLDHVVAATNSGGIRASVEIGDISRSTVKTILPFGSTIALNYITGAELLEALEASTYSTPEPLGGFPQIGGMKISIDTTVEYDAGSEYPDSTYCAPNSIRRVTILEVNGQPFDENATYAVVTNNFCAAGGDTYYSFKRAYDEGKGFDTSIPMDEALVNYISYELGGKIDERYAQADGRIKIIE